MGDWIGARTIDVELVDGTKHTVRTIFADAIAYETVARKHGYGSPRESTMQSLAFVCWHALKRAGVVTNEPYEQWRDTLVAIRPDDGESADPTRPGQRTG